MYLLKRLFSFLLFILFLIGIAAGQQGNSYTRVDEFVKNYPTAINNQQDLDKFIDVVNKKFTADVDKVRSAFYWISEHISYNYQAANDRTYLSKDITTLIQSGQALCSGYSNLMEYCCRKFGIECVTINGTGRSLYTDIIMDPQRLSNDHSWNAVKINGQWKLLDATWGSGFTDYATGAYHKSRNEKYFLSDPSFFIYKHLPIKPEWQLLDTTVSATRFCNWPFIDEGYFTNNLSAVYPFQLRINRKAGDTVVFKFYTDKELTHVAIESLDNQLVERGYLTKNSNYYSYVFRPKKTGEFDIRVSLFYLNERARYSTVTYSPALIYHLNVTR